VNCSPPNPSFARTPSFRPRSFATFSAANCGRLTLALELLALGTVGLGALTLVAQTASKPAAKPSAAVNKVAAIKSFRLIQEKDGPAVEILSTQPLVPAIQLINDPTRLVIDLPNARLDAPQKRFSIHADQISALRADQFQQNPPVARVVVDLLAPREYTWDAAGNRLVVHLGKTLGDAPPLEPQPVASVAPSAPPVVKAVRAAGPLAIAADTGNVGASFTAGADTAVLRLSSGGEVRVCPGTTVSITPSQNRHNLMLGMNTGALEAHMSLDASTDSVMTPDFRIALVGPGEFHYAFSADHQGNTCVRALPGNTASAIVTELLGDRTYQVKATDQLVFRSGQLDRVDMAVPLECGCPPPQQTTERATNDLPVQSSAPSEARPPARADSQLPVETPRIAEETPHIENAPPAEVPVENTPHASADSSSDNQLHVQVTAPLVFHATGPPPAPVEDVQALPIESRGTTAPELSAAPAPPPAQVAPPTGSKPTAAAAPQHRGFFRRLGAFFAAMFR